MVKVKKVKMEWFTKNNRWTISKLLFNLNLTHEIKSDVVLTTFTILFIISEDKFVAILRQHTKGFSLF